ncbi:MAG: hypothetical protein E6R03_07855 [Hyphomicrobiaceae bacterium]|nr:MAG: hypothetical protein E6R03_07855 [Hyphomicrobiaceae bacterium]
MTHLEKTLLAYFSDFKKWEPIQKNCVDDYRGHITEDCCKVFIVELSKDLARHIRHAKPRPKSKKSRVRKFEKDDIVAP